MRTSLNQQVQSSQTYLSLASSKLVDAQTRASSGKRILKPSDDVPGTNQALSLRTAISNGDQLANNITVAKPLVEATESAMSSLVDITRSVRDIAVAAASPDVTGNARSAYVSQLNDALAQMADVANTKYMDQYVFSGTATQTAPLAAQAGSPPYTYQGNSGIKSTQVLSWVSLATNIPGDKAFNFDHAAGADTTDLFTMVTQLRDAVQSGNVDQVSAQLTNVDANLDNLLSGSAQLGSVADRMDTANSVLSDSKTRLQTMLSNVEDVDMAQAITDLQTQQNVYQAALNVTGQVLKMSLASIELASGS